MNILLFTFSAKLKCTLVHGNMLNAIINSCKIYNDRTISTEFVHERIYQVCRAEKRRSASDICISCGYVM